MEKLRQLIYNKDVLGVLDHLKGMGVSNKRVSDLSGVHFTTVDKYKKGHFELSDEKKELILNTVMEVYL